LTEEGYFPDMEYLGIKQYGTNDQLFGKLESVDSDDNEEKYKFEGKMYSGKALLGLWEAECDQALKETPLSLYSWKMHNPQDRAKYESCGEFFCGVPY
jgi:hypothetical protein